MMHMSTYGLMQAGWTLVAAYEAFLKGQRKLNIECWKNGSQMLVRNWTTGHAAWDNVFTERTAANAEVNRLLKSRTEDGGWYKRIK